MKGIKELLLKGDSKNVKGDNKNEKVDLTKLNLPLYVITAGEFRKNMKNILKIVSLSTRDNPIFCVITSYGSPKSALIPPWALVLLESWNR